MQLRRVAVVVPVLTLLAGCKSKPPGTTPARDASADAGTPVSTVLLGRELDLRDVRWSSTGDVIATTRVGVLRFAPEIDAPARLLRLPDGETPARLATSRGADVVALVTESQRLFVSRDGSELRAIAGVGSPATVDVSDDGTLIAVDEPPAPGAARTAGLRDAVTGRQLRTFDIFARFDPSSKFVASSKLIASVDGTSADIPLGDQHFLVWVAGHAALEAKNALVLVEPATRTTKRIPMCGRLEVDVERSRAIGVCEGRNTLEVVALPGGERMVVPLPPKVAHNFVAVFGAREGDDLFVQHGEANYAGEIHELKALRVDVAARKTEAVPLETLVVRELGGDHTLESASSAQSPRGRRSFEVGSPAVWPVRIRDVRGLELARWGPDSALGLTSRVRARERGLDLELAKVGVSNVARVRVGPPAPGIAEDLVPKSDMAKDTCGQDAHVRLGNGRMLWYPFDKQEWHPVACSCADFVCTKPFEATGGRVLDARADIVVIASTGNGTAIRFVDPGGTTRTSATIGDAASCKQARLAVDGRSAGFYCTRGDDERELVEIDVATGKELRRTPLGLPGPNPWTLEAMGKGAIVFSPPRHRWISPGLIVLEPSTGRRIVDVLALPNAAVARFEDGKVELFGDEASAAQAIRCDDGRLLLPFVTCRDRVQVKGRFALDL
ncbi:MAG: hypothetical protein J0I07_25830 [Myxococcales bacterium]|nr:hypothetical protein [Myxococcales bacterium]